MYAPLINIQFQQATNISMQMKLKSMINGKGYKLSSSFIFGKGYLLPSG